MPLFAAATDIIVDVVSAAVVWFKNMPVHRWIGNLISLIWLDCFSTKSKPKTMLMNAAPVLPISLLWRPKCLLTESEMHLCRQIVNAFKLRFSYEINRYPISRTGYHHLFIAGSKCWVHILHVNSMRHCTYATISKIKYLLFRWLELILRNWLSVAFNNRYCAVMVAQLQCIGACARAMQTGFSGHNGIWMQIGPQSIYFAIEASQFIAG